jgi:hypothetical protein
MLKIITGFSSVILRLVYVAGVLFVAGWLGIGVAMGFDAGVSAGPLFVVGVYLITFVPALLLAVLPLSVLTRPPFVLKVWYGWAILLLTSLAAYRAYHFFSSVVHMVTADPSKKSGAVCLYVANPEGAVWVDLKITGGEFHRVRQIPLTATNSWCINWTPSQKPMLFRFYSATERNMSGRHASEDDLATASKPVSVTVAPGSKTCISAVLDKQKTPVNWSAEVMPCQN